MTVSDRSGPVSGRGLPTLTLRGWFLLTSSATAVVVAYVSGWRSLLYVGLALLLVVVLSLVVVGARAGRVRVDRRTSPDPLSVGSVAEVTLHLANESWLPVPGSQWRDAAPDDVGGGPLRPLPLLAPRGWPGERARLHYSFPATRRGVFRLGPVLVRGSDAFGLCRREHALGEAGEIVVLPRVVPLTGAVSAPAALSDALARAATVGRGQDDVIAREYRPGGALRHVHGRASAHRGELMVRQEQRHDDAHAVVLLDNRREHWENAAAFEWAVSLAASIVVHLSTEGTGVRLVLTTPSAGEALDTAGGEELSATLMRLATVVRHSVRSSTPDYLALLSAAREEVAAPIFAITGVMDEAEWRSLVAHREPGTHAAAVLVATPGVPDLLWTAGWQCIEVHDPATDMVEVWRAASMGASRV